MGTASGNEVTLDHASSSGDVYGGYATENGAHSEAERDAVSNKVYIRSSTVAATDPTATAVAAGGEASQWGISFRRYIGFRRTLRRFSDQLPGQGFYRDQ